MSKSEKERKEWEDQLLKNVSYYVACRFLGVGKYERIENKSKELLYKELETRKGTKQRFLIYAVCPYCAYEYTIHIGGFIC